MTFISSQKETTYSLRVIAKSANGLLKEINASYEVTALFDTYGYMHRQAVKEKVIDDFMSKINKVI